MADGTLKLHERLTFDLAAGQVLDGPRRYVLMRADVLMGTFDELPGPAREEALQALARSVARQGGQSVRAYLEELGPQRLLQAMEAGSASLGWGAWQLRGEPGALHLSVRNSPFATATRRRDGPACHAIAGMLGAVATALWSTPAQARELQCACTGAAASTRCTFVATAAPAAGEAVSGPRADRAA